MEERLRDENERLERENTGLKSDLHFKLVRIESLKRFWVTYHC